jgi:23S rRNA (adenine2503-C2)-methyltransferase
MGMGEPMLNYEEVLKSTEIFMDTHGAGIGAKHITISTAGYADKIRRMADEGRKVRLALSLHSLDPVTRTRLMPVTKKFSIEDLSAALQYYYEKTRQRPTIEYILFDGVNDTTRDTDLLIRFSRRVPCKINLIPFHSISFTGPSGFASSLRPSSRDRIEWFAGKLRDAFVTVIVRSSSGVDINAACGQLAATVGVQSPR